MNSLHVLVAEDNSVNQRLARALLEPRCASVTVVEDGRAAVDAWATRRFGLVLMDIQMPEMDGIEATVRIRAAEGPGEHIPIVALTARAMAGDREECLAAGMDAYLSKPMRAAALIETIERLVQPASVSVSSPEKSSGDETLDLVRLRDNTGDDEALLTQLLSLFLAEAPVQLGAVRRGCAANDMAATVAAAHKLRGSAGAITATRLANAAMSIEIIAGSGAVPDSFVQSLDAEMRDVERLIHASGLIAPATPDGSPKKSVLVIDDDDSVRLIASRFLRREGYAVTDWPSAEAALGMLAASSRPIDLLITDAVMPGIDGFHAAERVRALRPGIPVVFMSGYGQEQLNVPAVTGHAFLAKPFDCQQLIAAVRRGLAQSECAA